MTGWVLVLTLAGPLLVIGLFGALTVITLVTTHVWTLLGRGLLGLFVILTVAFVTSLAWRLAGQPQPDIAYYAIRALFIVDVITILWGLRRYDWPERPDGIQWDQLFGRRRSCRY